MLAQTMPNVFDLSSITFYIKNEESNHNQITHYRRYKIWRNHKLLISQLFDCIWFVQWKTFLNMLYYFFVHESILLPPVSFVFTSSFFLSRLICLFETDILLLMSDNFVATIGQDVFQCCNSLKMDSCLYDIKII